MAQRTDGVFRRELFESTCALCHGKDEGARGLESGAPVGKYVVEYYGSTGNGGATGGAPANTADAAVGNSLASLRGACHTAYPSDGAGNAYTAGGVTHYRRKTELPFDDWSNPETGAFSYNPETNPVNFGGQFPGLRLASSTTETETIVTCLTCHRVHGTAATMEGYALKEEHGGEVGNDLTPSQTASSPTALLFTGNRGMCQACHQ